MDTFRRKPNQKGFTMIELMVVVVIVAILAAIAIPIYGKYIKNARMTEAESRIGEILTAAKAYAQETDTNDNGIGEWPPNATTGIVDMSNTEFFSYAITSGADAESNTMLEVTGTGLAGLKMAGASLVIQVANINANGRVTSKVLP